ncbi:MAG TPA: M20 family metallopeptidase [Candidatus Saccharimonadales bacterium]|jgi:glutamate carboxypeptidase|nr:M20 family metallopeptidase [Candidatus Saccharimonadales bacterium]
MTESNSPSNFLETLKPRLPEMLSILRQFVVAESPSLEKAPSDLCCSIIAGEWAKRSVRVDRLKQKRRGDQLRFTYWPHSSRPAGQLLILGHYDTVYATGTLAKMPFRVSGGKVFGPGTFDMKAGIVQGLFALDAIQQNAATLRKRLVFLWTSDEEIGSDASRKVIEEEARRSDAVLVLEPSFGPQGLLKTARKGVGEAELIVHGRSSHAGLAPQEGINAIHELAKQIERIQSWNDPERGVSVNVCVTEGGTRTNVIPERARALFDLRALRGTDMKNLERRLHALKPILRGAKLEVKGGFSRAPLEHKVTGALYARAKSLATQMGLLLGECTVGGGSDGNLTGALGVPTLDGLGAVGDGAHSASEHVIASTMPERAALLAALLSTI